MFAKRLVLALAGVAILGVVVVNAYAQPTKKSKGAAAPDCTREEAAALRARFISGLVSQGYHLTAAGKEFAKSPDPTTSAAADATTGTGGASGQVLLGTRSRSTRTTSSARRTSAVIPVFYYCQFGVQANMTFTTGVGPSYVDWHRHSTLGGYDAIRGPTGQCASGQCAYYAYHDPPISRAVDFGDLTAFTGGTVAAAYCHGG